MRSVTLDCAVADMVKASIATKPNNIIFFIAFYFNCLLLLTGKKQKVEFFSPVSKDRNIFSKPVPAFLKFFGSVLRYSQRMELVFYMIPFG